MLRSGGMRDNVILASDAEAGGPPLLFFSFPLGMPGPCDLCQGGYDAADTMFLPSLIPVRMPFVVPPFAECAKNGASTARVASATSTAEPHARISSERTVVGGFGGGELSGPPLKKQVPFDFAQGRPSRRFSPALRAPASARNDRVKNSS